MSPTHLHKNNASIPPSTLLITVFYEYNSSLCNSKTQRNAHDDQRQLRYLCAYVTYSPEEKNKKMNGNNIAIQRYKSHNAALAHHIIVADNEDDGTKDSISFARSNSYRTYKVSRSSEILLYNIEALLSH